MGKRLIIEILAALIVIGIPIGFGLYSRFNYVEPVTSYCERVCKNCPEAGDVGVGSITCETDPICYEDCLNFPELYGYKP